MKLNEILSQLLLAKTAEQIAAASQQVNDYKADAGAAEKEAIAAVIEAKAMAMAQESRELIERSRDSFVATEGKILNLDEWLTVKSYCQRYGIASTNVVSNWIKRGVIPQENVIQVAELNNLKLIKAVRY